MPIIILITILWLAGMLGQLLDIMFNFGKVGEDIRKSDGTPFDSETNLATIFLFYLKSRRISIFVTTVLLVIFAAIMIFDGVTLALLTKYHLLAMFTTGYGGQQGMRDMINIRFKQNQG